MLEAAGDRCLIVGLGGDELLSPQQWRPVHDLLGRRRRPQRRDLVRLAAGAVPRAMRGLLRPSRAKELETDGVVAPSGQAPPRPLVQEGIRGAGPVELRHQARRRPPRRDSSVPGHAASGASRAATGSRLRCSIPDSSARSRARADTPDGEGGPRPWTRWPATCCRRTSWDARARRTSTASSSARRAAPLPPAWSGRGLDETLVDPEALRREWLSEVPDFRTSLLLQSAWLADQELDPAARDLELDSGRMMRMTVRGRVRLSRLGLEDGALARRDRSRRTGPRSPARATAVHDAPELSLDLDALELRVRADVAHSELVHPLLGTGRLPSSRSRAASTGCTPAQSSDARARGPSSGPRGLVRAPSWRA